MLLLGIDLESTGTDEKKDTVIEVGAVLWDTDFNQPVNIFSALIKEAEDIVVPRAAAAVNHITTEMLNKHGKLVDVSLFNRIKQMARKAEYIVAHRVPFDRGMLEAMFERHGHTLQEKVWIDTITDLEYDEGCLYRNLTYVGAYHGFVNPFAHRAVTDVLAMFKIFQEYDLEKVLRRANSALLLVVAEVSFDDRQLAKDHRFHWEALDPDKPNDKVWMKEIREIDFEIESQNYEFEIKVTAP